ncbi:phosphatidylcholine synthase [Bradyrhizobium sp. NBAIM03]|uniref:phosphatidylcholine synthase n=2 Tax=Bradyrhizobium TaxID=374 RepID=UPI002A06ADC5|nr:phosphatidylcholine synthase [Bradyrhizobium sp. NBAIM20]MCA1466095.1 phosphatidylcholine synthase [Bradyrhizobium sp. NBAIM18]MCA1502077.1 phosphatidylcholine synthase [Bradyrhizobium sp. NBAIM14]MCA1530616.1 phosphatidylcholine synthase [Bradyrhizobium yuanmingense]MCA1537912.1 phosphatidylcholine synthase [Bradyrhizobium sp. NBAIM03]
MADVQTGRILIAEAMDTQQDSLKPRPVIRAAAFSVHIFTAFGAAIALLAMLEAVREHWAAMFQWLGVALIIDAIDGPIARRLDVKNVQPNWSGDVLDLVVDFCTYVFVPAYAIVASGMLLPVAAPLLGIAIIVTSALYFADQRMKADDNHFRGFPALWNAAAFYLFLLHWPPLWATLLVAALVVLTFVPFHVLHPVRVVRLRWLTMSLIAVWALLAFYTLQMDFRVGTGVTVVLCAIALWISFSDALIRLAKSLARLSA